MGNLAVVNVETLMFVIAISNMTTLKSCTSRALNIVALFHLR